MKLLQKSLIKSQSFLLDNSKIRISSKSLGNNEEFEIAFEEILPNKYDIKKNNIFLFVLAIFFYSLSILLLILRLSNGNVGDFAELFWGFIATVLLLLAIITKENYWRINISNNTFIKIMKNSPNKQDVNFFIEILFENRKQYLREHYGKINSNLDFENQHNTISWLRNMKAIDEKEFEDKINELEIAFGKKQNKIGFL